MARLPLTFSAGNFPEGFQGTPQQIAIKIAELLIAEIEADFLGGQVDGVPSPTSGLWLHKISDPNESYEASWYSDKYAKYLPIYTVPVGTVIMYAANGTPPNFIDCDGAEYTVTAKPQLYDAIGIIHGGTLGVKFNVPDYRGRIPLGHGTGIDYIAGTDALTQRTMGKPAGYVGHDFIHQIAKVPNGPSVPANQRAALKPPGTAAGIPSAITSGMPAATVIRFLIKYQ